MNFLYKMKKYIYSQKWKKSPKNRLYKKTIIKHKKCVSVL